MIEREGGREEGREGGRKLLARCTASNCDSQLVTLEVGSRGFLNASNFDHFTVSNTLLTDIIKKCIVHSHDIWCRVEMKGRR